MSRPAFAFVAAALLATTAARAEDVSTKGRVETDLYTYDESPPSALLDGDKSTHFTQQRLQDAEWRVWLSKPAKLDSVTFIQGWPDWSQATGLRLETADGSTTDLTLVAGTRDPQTFSLAFDRPTAFVDVRVTSANPAKDGKGYGGFAEMSLSGTPEATPGAPPLVSSVDVVKASDTSATVTWTTDVPSTSQLRFSSESGVTTTPPDTTLVTSHSVAISSQTPLRGQIELRSADEHGNRAELRNQAFVTIDTKYQYGAGGWTFHLGDKWVPAADVYAADGLTMGFTQSWIGGDGWTGWFKADGVAAIRAAGMTPEVVHYYFGDPKLDDVEARSAAFLADIGTLADLLAASGVGDKTLVTLEPEYNQGAVATWEPWNDLMIQAIDILHTKAGAKVGLLPGDWDIEHVVPISMGRAAAKADFVAFQEMRASTQDKVDDAGRVVSHAIRFAHYLSRTFLRPVRWGYLMVSDYGGWTYVQRNVVIEMCERAPELEAAGVVAVSWMSYLDDPGSGGYFAEAESHKGLKDAESTPKPAWLVWKECVRNGASWKATGAEPPGAPPPDDPRGCSCTVVGGRGSAGGAAALLLVLGAFVLRRYRAPANAALNSASRTMVTKSAFIMS